MDRLLSYFTFKTKKQFQQKQENHSKTTIIDSSQPFLEKNKTQMFWKKKKNVGKKNYYFVWKTSFSVRINANCAFS